MFIERQLTEPERQLTEWLLRNGSPHATDYIDQLPSAKVLGVCGCGCASINFLLDEAKSGGMDVLSDYCWTDDRDRMGGVFVFAMSGQLAGLEVYSMDGECDASKLPEVERLVPLTDTANGG